MYLDSGGDAVVTLEIFFKVITKKFKLYAKFNKLITWTFIQNLND